MTELEQAEQFVLALREYYLRGYRKGYDDAVNGQGREDQAGDALTAP